MCGRFTITVTYNELEQYIKDQFDLTFNKLEVNVPNYNISPTNDIISVINDGTHHRIGKLKWGFLPPFKIDSKIGFINAMEETIFEKPSFKKAALNQRCIVLADGYYEWKKSDTKIPHLIKTKDGLFKMAAIWNTVTNQDNNKVNTVAIITTKANAQTSSIHERMPVILSDEAANVWLNPKIKDIDILKSQLTSYNEEMIIYPVSSEVNNVRNNYPSLIAKI